MLFRFYITWLEPRILIVLNILILPLYRKEVALSEEPKTSKNPGFTVVTGFFLLGLLPENYLILNFLYKN